MERPRQLRVNVERARAIIAKANNMGKRAHDRFELSVTTSVRLGDMECRLDRLAGFYRLFELYGVMQAINCVR